MAIYHLHVKNISRGDGRSAVAAAAYRAGETLPNEAEERDSAFGGRRDVVHAEIRTPAQAPAWMADRARLWNAVEAAEKRKDARLAKEIEFAIPRELPRDLWISVAREMADAYTTQGHVVDFAIHSGDHSENPHVHMMLATRVIAGDRFGNKLREADGLKFVTEARALWASIANTALGKVGAGVEIDPRSYAARGIAQAPTAHRGPDQAERRARRQRSKEYTMAEVFQSPTPASADLARLDALEAENRMLREALEAQQKDEGRRAPVPDPDGRPISPEELRAAEDRMIEDAEAPRRDVPPPEREALAAALKAAERAVDRQMRLEVPDKDRDAYRIAPHENHLDWLDDTVAVETCQSGQDRGSDHLDWLRDERSRDASYEEQDRELER